MKRTVFIFVSFVCFVGTALAGVDAERLASAIRPIERWDGRDGRHGERGPYGTRAIAWRQFMPGVPFDLARQEGPARACALKHIAWLARELRKAGWPDNAHTIALAYNAGLTAVLTGKVPMASYDYALRVENIYLTRNAQ